ncbi:MAG TPA: FAD-dependent monooxygenase [Hyphomicrobiaceae bacterium]|nr:FAD-dependent monooxygenase [Hyphomicrobiaceae bacterium]
MSAVKPPAEGCPGAQGTDAGAAPGACTEACDVAMVGGGPVGLALACALADGLGTGARIAVIDRAFGGTAVPPTRDPRASALSAGSKRLLDVIGVWEALAPHAQPVAAVDITDSSLGDAFRPVLISYDNSVEAGEPATYILENDRLRTALSEAVARRGGTIACIAGELAGWEARDGFGLVRLGDGRTFSASLAVAADGRSSALRRAAGISVIDWRYGQVGIVAMVRHEKPHQARAVQHFLPAGPFAILPLRDDGTGHRSCITWTEEESWGRALVQLDDAAFLKEVETRFGYRLGRIELAGSRGAWPLGLHLARALVADRLALAGDAAHLVHPIAGQGLNLGFRDVAALAEVVVDAARLGLDIGSGIVLERYTRWRRTDATMSAVTFDALNRLFSNDWTLMRTARDAGLRLVDGMPGLKQFLVAEAAGLTGEVPRLLRGEPV